MKIQIKRLVGTTWTGVPIAELLETSVIDYMIASKDVLVAGLLEEDKPIAFISNDYAYVDQYKEKAFSVHAKDMQTMLAGVDQVNLISRVFPDGCVAEIEPMGET